MRNVAAGLACTVALCASQAHASGASRTVPFATAAVFRALVLERIRAYARGDVAAYVRLLAPDFVHVSDLGERRTLSQMRAFVGGHGRQPATFDVTEFTWRVAGSFAIVDALVRERRTDFSGGIRETDVFVARDEHAWRYLRHHETALAIPARATPLGGDRLRDYVGRYRSDAGVVDVVTATATALYDRTLPDADRTPLVHIARGAFVFAGDPTLVVFVRDALGAVTRCLFHLPSGQTVLSRRIR